MQTQLVRKCWLAIILTQAVPLLAQQPKPSAETLVAWDRYVSLTERDIQNQLNNSAAFVRSKSDVKKTKKVHVEELETKDEAKKQIKVTDGTIHHWLGAIYVPGKSLQDVLRWVRDYDRHKDYFVDIEQSSLKRQDGDTYDVFLRMKRSKWTVTARFNTDHRVVYSHHGIGRASSKSVATRIRQLDKEGNEYLPGRDDGYLWRLNSYWRFSEHDGGVIVECETIGLSRSLGSFVGFFDFLTFGGISKIAESIAEEALTDMLTALRDGVLR